MDVRVTLIQAGEELPASTRRAIAALGPAAVGPLCDVLSDEALHQETAPGEGWAPIHAASLLGDIGSPDGAPALVSAVSKCEPMEILYSTCIDALSRLGPAALEHTLVLTTLKGNEAAVDAGAEALAKSGVRDPRILAVLLAGLKRLPGLYAGHFAIYGDPAALPALHAALALQEPPAEASVLAGQDIVELTTAIEELGGTVGASGKAKLAALDRMRAPMREQLLAALTGRTRRRRRR